MFEDIVEQASQDLVTLPDAARAEVWVSAIFGSWRQAGVGDELNPEAIDAEFLSFLEANPSEAGLAIAYAANAMNIARAGEVVAHLTACGMRQPYWHEIVGTAAAVAAWVVHDADAGADSIIIEFEHDDEQRHSMLVEVDQGVCVDILFGPPGLVETLHAGPDRYLVAAPLDIEEAAEQIAVALGRTDQEPDPAVTEEFGMNVVLAAARLTQLGARGSAPRPKVVPPREVVRDVEADRYAASTLQAALRSQLALDAPSQLEGAIADFDRLVADGDPDALLLLDEAGTDARNGRLAYLAAVAAYATPGPLSAFARPHRELIELLEWADWLGAVVQLVRSGPGTSVDPAVLVDGINRCPEVVDTIPKAERRAVETAFDLVLHAWSATGVIDEDGLLTEVGAWALPRALLQAWSGDEQVAAG